MLPDAECVRIMCEILSGLELGIFVIKLNHRQLLDGIFEVCGCPPEKFRATCSAVDKLDKVHLSLSLCVCECLSTHSSLLHPIYVQMSWEDVRKEMVEEKGLPAEVADRIGGYVKQHGARDLLKRLQEDAALMGVTAAKEGLDAMALLFDYCEHFGVLDKVRGDVTECLCAECIVLLLVCVYPVCPVCWWCTSAVWCKECVVSVAHRCRLTSAWREDWTITRDSYMKLY